MSKELSNSRAIIIPVVVSLVGVVSMSSVAYLLDTGGIPLLTISDHRIVNFTFTMQLIMLPISFAALEFMYVYNRENFRTFFRWSMSFSGKEWSFYGPAIAIALTLGNAVMMSAGVIEQNGEINTSFYALLPWVLLFAATNAWTEEIFTRFVIITGLHGVVNPVSICWISAIIFGVPHFFGTPSGVFGVIASGFMGWLLAKSVIETKGLGWALTIHFLQDVVIFGAGAMIIAGQS